CKPCPGITASSRRMASSLHRVGDAHKGLAAGVILTSQGEGRPIERMGGPVPISARLDAGELRFPQSFGLATAFAEPAEEIAHRHGGGGVRDLPERRPDGLSAG